MLANRSVKGLIEILDKENLIKSKDINTVIDVDNVADISFDSRFVVPNSIFICKGEKFDKSYLDMAVRNGALIYISEEVYKEINLPNIIVNDIRKAMAVISNWFSNSVWQDIPVIAIGGTKGKSTSTYMLRSVLDAYAEYKGIMPAGIISSIEVFDGCNKQEAVLTTPEAVEIHKILLSMKENKLPYCLLETSSQAFKYDRVYGMRFHIGSLLNIDMDHISPIEHPTLEDYIKAKLMMIGQSEKLVLGKDYELYNRVEKYLQDSVYKGEIITFSIKDKNSDLYGYDIYSENMKMNFKCKINNQILKENYKIDEIDFEIDILGEFNVENALSVIAISMLLNIPMEVIKKGLASLFIPGRMEILKAEGKNLYVIVDYAHNKLSFQSLFENMRKEFREYDIYAVFGAPGNKAKNRRRELSEEANDKVDRSFLVPEDPNTENAIDISLEMSTYFDSKEKYNICNSRTEGIEKAIKEAELALARGSKGVVIAVTGKGREESFKEKGKSIRIESDYNVVKRVINNI